MLNDMLPGLVPGPETTAGLDAGRAQFFFYCGGGGGAVPDFWANFPTFSRDLSNGQQMVSFSSSTQTSGSLEFQIPTWDADLKVVSSNSLTQASR